MKHKTLVSLALASMLAFAVEVQAGPADTTAAVQASELQRQEVVQGPMLYDELEEARAAGLRGDHWTMTYALREARRLLRSMTLAQDLAAKSTPAAAKPKATQAKSANPEPRTADKPGGKAAGVALDERVEIDEPMSGNRLHRLDEADRPIGRILLTQVSESVDQALYDLGDNPPTMGAALIATQQALDKIRWRIGLDPSGWAKARDQLIQGYGLLLDHDPDAMHELRKSGKLLAELPDGKAYAAQLTQALQSASPDTAGLVALIRALDSKIKGSRMSAELSRLEGGASGQR